MNEFKEPRVGSTIMRVLEGKAYITVTFEETDAFKNRASGSHIRKVDTCGFICQVAKPSVSGGAISSFRRIMISVLAHSNNYRSETDCVRSARM